MESKGLEMSRKPTDEVERRESERPWHLDKRIPITFIVFLLIQTATLIWYTGAHDAKVDAKIEQTMEKVAVIEKWRDDQSGTAVKTESRLAVIEERTTEQSETLHRIDARLESMLTFKK